MRSKATHSCAVGAMLFGGTLGTTSIASAGVTWLNSLGGTPGGNSYNYVNVSSGPFAYASGAASLVAQTLTAGSSSFSISASTASGVSMSANNPGGTAFVDPFQIQRYFTVTGSAPVSITWAANPSSLVLALLSGTSWGFVPGLSGAAGWSDTFEGSSATTSSGSTAFTLGAGTYRLNVSYEGNPNGQLFSFAVIPAPGAVALLGAAGLVGSRRRRS